MTRNNIDINTMNPAYKDCIHDIADGLRIRTLVVFTKTDIKSAGAAKRDDKICNIGELIDRINASDSENGNHWNTTEMMFIACMILSLSRIDCDMFINTGNGIRKPIKRLLAHSKKDAPEKHCNDYDDIVEIDEETLLAMGAVPIITQDGAMLKEIEDYLFDTRKTARRDKDKRNGLYYKEDDEIERIANDICNGRPSTTQELKHINGIGDKTIEIVADDIFQIVKKYR